MVGTDKFGLDRYKDLSFKARNTDNEPKTTITCVIEKRAEFDDGRVARGKVNTHLYPRKVTLYVGQEVDAEKQLYQNIPSILRTWHGLIGELKATRVSPSEVANYTREQDDAYTTTFYQVFTTMVDYTEIEPDVFAYVSTEVADYAHVWIKTHAGYQFADEFYSFMRRYGIGYSQAKNVAERQKAREVAESQRTETSDGKTQSRGRGRPVGWRKAKAMLKAIGTIETKEQE